MISGMFEESPGRQYHGTREEEVCLSKRMYFTRRQASKALRYLRRKRQGYDVVTAYHCRVCNGWHLGHPIGLHRRLGNELLASTRPF